MCDLDLSRRAVACRGWRWMPGMRVIEAQNGCDSMLCWHDGQWSACTVQGAWLRFRDADKLRPDLRDPATRGCLLQLVREAWSDPGLHIQGQYHAGHWRWRFRGGHPHGGAFNRVADVWHETEEAALVAALEAAPTR